MSLYKDFSENELIEAYSSMMDYSGKLTDDLIFEIEKRGGLELFNRKMELRKVHGAEISRIIKEVQSISKPETDIAFVRKHITSKILSKEELDRFVETTFDEYQALLKDKGINSKTIIGSISGVLFGSLIGGIGWGLSNLFFHRPFHYLIPFLFIICYLIIKFITKQSRRNVVILVASFLATIGAILLGGLISGIFI